MTIRIYLKPTATEHLTNMKNEHGEYGEYLDGVKVDTDKTSGEKYIGIYANPLSPDANVPRAVRKHVNRVTFAGRFYRNFRADGIYKNMGATARLEVVVLYNGRHDGEERHQNITITAGSMRTLNKTYSKIRTGELEPAENWSDPSFDSKQCGRKAAEGGSVEA